MVVANFQDFYADEDTKHHPEVNRFQLAYPNVQHNLRYDEIGARLHDQLEDVNYLLK